MKRHTHLTAWLLALLVCHVDGLQAGEQAGNMLASEHSQWRAWLDFAPDQVDPTQARAAVAALSERAQERLQEEVLLVAAAAGVDVTKDGFDWHDHLLLMFEPYISTYSPITPNFNSEWGLKDQLGTQLHGQAFAWPQVAADWYRPGFDEAGWVSRSAPVQMGDRSDLPEEISKPALTTDTSGVRAAYFRTEFHLQAPAECRISAVYRGGLRVFINGSEVLRRHLPDGPLDAQSRATGYGEAVRDRWDNGAWMDRKLNNYVIPAQALRPGSNLLAVEVRAPFIHRSAVQIERRAARQAVNEKEDKFNVARAHASLRRFSLIGPGSPALARPAGLQVWTGDIHQRPHDRDFLPPGWSLRPLEVVGPRGGRHSALLMLGSDTPVEGVQVIAEGMRGEAGSIPATAISLRAMLPRPSDNDTLSLLGRHRGKASLGGNHDNYLQWTTWRYRGYADGQPESFFDELGEAPPRTLAAGKCQPVWVEVTLPRDAKPGRYQGAVTVSASGIPPVSVPLIAEVLPWILPEPRDWQADVWIEQSPWGVAAAGRVEPWSEDHWRLMASSWRQLARVGAEFVHVPLLQFSEFGNQEDALVRWSRAPGGTGGLIGDFARLDRYLETAMREIGRPRVICVGLMQGAGGPGRGATIMRNVTTIPMIGEAAVDVATTPGLYEEVAKAMHAHLKAKGLDGALRWGQPWDFPPDPELPARIAAVVPNVSWMRAGHCDLGTPSWVGVQSEVWPSWSNRPADAINVLNPRRHSPFHLLEGWFPPYAFRVFPIRASHAGYTGIGRMGADYWDQLGAGNIPRGAVPDFGTKNLLWPGPGTMHGSQRLEILREGLQEDEAYRFLHTALRGGKLPDALGKRVAATLNDWIGLTTHMPAIYFGINNPTFHDHTQLWQQRARQLYVVAGDVAAAMR